MRVGPPGNRGAHHRSWFARIGALTVHVQYGDRGLLGNGGSDSPREGWDAWLLREGQTRVDGSKESVSEAQRGGPLRGYERVKGREAWSAAERGHGQIASRAWQRARGGWRLASRGFAKPSWSRVAA